MQVKLGCEMCGEIEEVDGLGNRLGDLFFGGAKEVACLEIESCGLRLRGLS